MVTSQSILVFRHSKAHICQTLVTGSCSGSGFAGRSSSKGEESKLASQVVLKLCYCKSEGMGCGASRGAADGGAIINFETWDQF